MKHSISTVILLLLANFIINPLYADSPGYSQLYQLAQGNSKTLNQAIQSVKKQTGGRVLSSKTIKNNGQTLYKIKVLLPSGKVQTFTVAAD